MVSIIKKGVLPQDRWFQDHCRNCNTHFKYQQREAKLCAPSDDRGRATVSISCPLCQHLCSKFADAYIKEDAVDYRPSASYDR